MVVRYRDRTMTQPTNATITPIAADQELFELVRGSDLGRDATDSEIRFFLYTARRLGLDPLARQLYMRKNDRGRMEPLLTIDGYRAVADRTGECDGQEPPLWCGEDGVWRDVWLTNDSPHACKITVYRKGQTHGYTGVATYVSYVVHGPDGEPTQTWSKLPDGMLAKCSEAIALRKAFPKQLSGMYIAEEMEQARTRARGAAGDTHRDRQAKRPEPRRSGEHVLELNEDGMARVFARIHDAAKQSEMDSIADIISRLVDAQKRELHAAWCAKASANGWAMVRAIARPIVASAA
jgi:phage recombination protein Bet